MSTTKNQDGTVDESLRRQSPFVFEPRKLDQHLVGGPNAHVYWFRARNHIDGSFFGPLRIVTNYLIIYACKHLPSLTAKRWIFRRLGMKLGNNATIASGVTMDYFFPELIEIGDNSIVGMDSMLLTHEFLHDRFCTGRITIGANCMVGAQSTVLAGVSVAHGTTIAAMSLVNKSIQTGGGIFGGVPVRHREQREA